jgi:nitroreductase
MDFFETISRRRSIRRFNDSIVPDEVIDRALEAAIWAPNSSNMQTWNFYWIKEPKMRRQLALACLNQSAARNAQHLIAVTADAKLWKRSLPFLRTWVKEANAPKPVQLYYDKLVPMTYRSGWLNAFGVVKWTITTIVGLFKPIPRGPHFQRDIQEVAVKSAALACENFVLAIAAQNFDTCMMEGFDFVRVKKLLKLGNTEDIVMVIAVGKSTENGTWGPAFRIPKELVIHKF